MAFSANIIGSLAWPVSVVIGIFLLRGHIAKALPFLRKLKYGDIELDFGRRVREVKEEVEKHLPARPGTATLDTGTIMRVAGIDPKAAVLAAWAEVECAAIESARRLGNAEVTKPHQALSYFERHSHVGPNLISVLHDLRHLRDQAAHAPDFQPDTSIALEYATTAAAVANFLRSF
jgi:hypothetical protein